MIDYSKGEKFHIENVEHEIHILEIKANFWPFIMFSFIFFLPVNPIFSFFASALIALISRKIFKLEEKGTPLEYEFTFLKTMQKFFIYPLIINPPIILPREKYRE